MPIARYLKVNVSRSESEIDLRRWVNFYFFVMLLLVPKYTRNHFRIFVYNFHTNGIFYISFNNLVWTSSSFLDIQFFIHNLFVIFFSTIFFICFYYLFYKNKKSHCSCNVCISTWFLEQKVYSIAIFPKII